MLITGGVVSVLSALITMSIAANYVNLYVVGPPEGHWWKAFQGGVFGGQVSQEEAAREKDHATRAQGWVLHWWEQNTQLSSLSVIYPGTDWPW